jgi:CDP-6-deoxy-D-xylo-4-hexulose-3-dehydrase
MKYKLATNTWDDKEITSIQRVIDSQNFSMGNEVSSYEKEFANYFGSDFAVMTSSGSTANLLMIASLFFCKDKKKRLKRGDEIIVPSVSWSTTYFPLQQYGLKVKFIDINIETLNFDLDELDKAISNKTKAILAVNLLGNPNDFDKIFSMIKDRNILLLEDNCESMGSMFNGRYAGTFGLMGTFSSFFSHHIATMEGGCILTDDEEIYHILLCLRAHGWTRNLPDKNHVTGIKSKDDFEESFKFVLPGYNVRPLEMSGAIGREQLKKLPKFIEVRKENSKIFKDLFHNNDDFIIQKEIGTSSWFGFSMIIKENSNLDRKSLIDLLTKKGIDTRPIVTGNFVKNKSVLKHFNYEVFGNLYNADYLENRGFFIGNSHIDLFAEINYLNSVLKSISS